jgi:hypothetical protein
MYKIVNTLAVALSVLPNFPSVTVAAEAAPVPAKRRALMDARALFCGDTAGKVVAFKNPRYKR